MNWGRDAEARNMTLFGKLADGKDGGLMSQNNHHVGAWMPGSFMNQRSGWQGEGKGGEETK